MSDILSTTTTFISSFVSWITSMTLTLITNPIVLLCFGSFLSFFVFRLIINLILSFFDKKELSSDSSSPTDLDWYKSRGSNGFFDSSEIDYVEQGRDEE